MDLTARIALQLDCTPAGLKAVQPLAAALTALADALKQAAPAAPALDSRRPAPVGAPEPVAAPAPQSAPAPRAPAAAPEFPVHQLDEPAKEPAVSVPPAVGAHEFPPAGAATGEARQVSPAEPDAAQVGAPSASDEPHTLDDVRRICAALRADFPEHFSPVEGREFTRRALDLAGLETFKDLRPDEVEKLYRACVQLDAEFRAAQGGAA